MFYVNYVLVFMLQCNALYVHNVHLGPLYQTHILKSHP